MKRLIFTLVIVAAMASTGLAKVDLVTLPSRDTVQLTIYNSADMTLVRESRALTLKGGGNKLQFSWANTLIDPTSLEMLPRASADEIEIDDLTYPPRVRNLGLWNIDSDVSGKVPVEITYLTSGLSWRAFYMGTLTEDEKTMRLQGYVRVTNSSGEDYENAQTRLIVGKVHILDQIAVLARRQYPYDRPGEPTRVRERFAKRYAIEKDAMEERAFAAFPKAPDKPKEIKKEGLSEYFLYTIEGTETIPTGWSKRLMSFDEEKVPVINLYKYEQERYGNSVVRFLSFKNDEEHKLGETPIPGGMLKVYRGVGDEGYLSYTGQSSFKYIPVDEDVELNLGAVGNVVVEPKLMDYRTENYRFDHRGNISGWDEVRTFKIEVKNTRDIRVKVEIKRNFPTQYWKLQRSGEFGEFEEVDLNTVKFTLELEPRSKRKFGYVLTIHRELSRDDLRRSDIRIVREGWGQEMVVSQSALQFHGKKTYVEVKDNPGLDLAGPLTLEAWIKFDQGGTENPRIISKGWEVHTGYELLLHGVGKQRRFQFAARGLGRFDSQSSIVAGRWYHLAVTYDGQKVTMLLNGKVDCIHKARGQIAVNDVAVNFGRNSQNGSDLYEGEIAEVRIWSRALPDMEIRENLIASATDRPGLAGWWDFRQYRNADAVPDISGHGNQAKIVRGR